VCTVPPMALRSSGRRDGCNTNVSLFYDMLGVMESYCHMCELTYTKRQTAQAWMLTASSKTSRTTACSSVSHTSANPASSEYRPGAHRLE
jgi:hypothetical protein